MSYWEPAPPLLSLGAGSGVAMGAGGGGAGTTGRWERRRRAAAGAAGSAEPQAGGHAALLPGLRERADRRGGPALPPLRVQHLPLRAQRHAQGGRARRRGRRSRGRPRDRTFPASFPAWTGVLWALPAAPWRSAARCSGGLCRAFAPGSLFCTRVTRRSCFYPEDYLKLQPLSPPRPSLILFLIGLVCLPLRFIICLCAWFVNTRVYIFQFSFPLMF